MVYFFLFWKLYKIGFTFSSHFPISLRILEMWKIWFLVETVVAVVVVVVVVVVALWPVWLELGRPRKEDFSPPSRQSENITVKSKFN
jgi:hypothetical protein